jgi:hypothetical protein
VSPVWRKHASKTAMLFHPDSFCDDATDSNRSHAETPIHVFQGCLDSFDGTSKAGH